MIHSAMSERSYHGTTSRSCLFCSVKLNFKSHIKRCPSSGRLMVVEMAGMQCLHIPSYNLTVVAQIILNRCILRCFPFSLLDTSHHFPQK